MHPEAPSSSSRRLTLKLAASALAAQVVSGCGGSSAEASTVTSAALAPVTAAVGSFAAIAEVEARTA